MISKKVSVKAAGKGKLSRLVNYLLDAKSKGSERVAAVAVTNCRSEDTTWAVREMQATQERNQRAKGDKTYHLVVSFRSGEDVSAEALGQIEEEFARALGFAGHQRVSVVHRDTDNLHLHVAINKVHPERFTLHEPFNDYHVREKLCQRLERRYGLEPDRSRTGNPREVPTQEKAATMESVAGVESLAGYVQRSLREVTMQARSWRELHQAFGKAGVALQARGNGLVVQSGGKTAKASSCFRELSKAALEKRLGTFLPPGQPPGSPVPASAYEPKPLQQGNTNLYAQYQAGRAEVRSTRTKQLDLALAAHRARVELAKRRYQVHRTTLRAVHGGPLKKVASGLHRGRLKQSVDASYKTFRAEKAAILRSAPLLAWNDWLMQQAARGSQPAAAALQARRRANPKTSPPTRSGPALVPPKLPSCHARPPDYTQRNSSRTRGFQRIAALLQSRFGRAFPRRAPEALARVRNLSGLDVVFQPERAAVLLHPDAPGRLGTEVAAGPAMRRQGTGVAGAGSRSGGRAGATITDGASPYVTRNGTFRGGAKNVSRTVEPKKDRAPER